MPALPPLGRSLVPLPSESLPGFILRLSYRLGLSPARLASRTGLVTADRSGARASASLLTDIPTENKSAFAHTTRLSVGQVEQLGLASLQQHYPIPPQETKNKPARMLVTNRSILAPETRFCPDCLAGDGSPIQEAFGGTWRRIWHLPVVFACTQHQRLLEHQCPECHQIVHRRRPGAPALLLPAMRAAPLHPAQCRTALAFGKGSTRPICCGRRLDHIPNRRPASPELLALQHKILDLLEPGGASHTVSAAQPTDTTRYFTDLQALTLLICSTWPKARGFSPSDNTANAIDHHIESQRKHAADRHHRSTSSTGRVTFDPPPADAAASAGLTHIADQILQSGGPNEVRERLQALLAPTSTRQASRSSWGLRVSRTTTPCSEGLTIAYEPLLRTFTKIGGQRHARRAAIIQPQRWGPEHIPALLPKDWYERHFTPLTGVNPTLIRRTAVLRLVQMITGGSLGEAAGFLGIANTDTTYERKGRIYSGAGHVHSSAKKQSDPHAFETALTALAAELDEPSTPLINYQRRRQALETWFIDEPTWNDLLSRLPPVPGPQRPELGDRKRQIASIYIWVQLTSGEHIFAPRPIEDAQPPATQDAWRLRRNTTWHLLQSARCRPHYISLKTELHTLATNLAPVIDTPY